MEPTEELIRELRLTRESLDHLAAAIAEWSERDSGTEHEYLRDLTDAVNQMTRTLPDEIDKKWEEEFRREVIDALTSIDAKLKRSSSSSRPKRRRRSKEDGCVVTFTALLITGSLVAFVVWLLKIAAEQP